MSISKRPVTENLEDRAKYFMEFKKKDPIFNKNIYLISIYNNSTTIEDGYSKYNKYNIQTNTKNIDNPIEKTNESKKSTQNPNNNTQDGVTKKCNSIKIHLNLNKYEKEPKYQKKILYKLQQKIANDTDSELSPTIFENTENLESEQKIISENKLKNLESCKKNIEFPKNETNSNTQDCIEEIKINTNNSINNIENNNNNNYDIDTFINGEIFNLLMKEENCFKELMKDFKGNGLANMKYKIKVSITFFDTKINLNNSLSDLLLYNIDDINSFFTRETCLFLIFLFFEDFAPFLNDEHVSEFTNCINYCHTNLIYVMMIVINKFESITLNNDDKISQVTNYDKCKTIINIYKNKINFNKYKETFHINNKIIKNILQNLFISLKEINNEITQNILTVFNYSKLYQFKTVINNCIIKNKYINDKLTNLITTLTNPEKIYPEQQFNILSNNNITTENNINQTINQNNLIKIDDLEIYQNSSPQPPFLPPKKNDDNREYTLVLDLDETLVHYFEDNSEAYVKVRMGAENFITELSKFCEIVIFTASTQNYADIVLDGFDCKNLIDYKLYREHVTEFNGMCVKDLSKLGRDLNKVIIIDNIEENFRLQPKNGLNIIDFEGDEKDNEFQFLLEDLLKIVSVPGKNICNELPVVRKNMEQRYCKMFI